MDPRMQEIFDKQERLQHRFNALMWVLGAIALSIFVVGVLS